jgi:hypothetical protein
MTSLDASAMSPAARLNDSSATATSNDLVRTIVSAVLDLVRSEPGLRAELQRVLVAAKPDRDEMLARRRRCAGATTTRPPRRSAS